MSERSSGTQSVIEDLMKTNGFSGESRFYRYTLPEFLTKDEEAGGYRLSSDPDPAEAVVDVYSQGHVSLAKHVGPGLAFAESADNTWCSAERTCVELRLQDVIDQGGRIYPVESVTTERTWYATLPQGSIRVSKVEAG